MEILIAQPLFATAHSPVSEQSGSGSAWERWEDRGHGGHPRPIVPEPSAYGAAMLTAVLAVVVWRRLSSLRSIGPR